jgi:Asp-tRNA(Asn)/Glu-tRNA(Gln) amidotransferase B subunit
MLAEKKINNLIARKVLCAVIEYDCDPEALKRENMWEQITDKVRISKLVDLVIERSSDEVRKLRSVMCAR